MSPTNPRAARPAPWPQPCAARRAAPLAVVLALAAWGGTAAAAFGDTVSVRVVFEFRDDVARRRYLDSERPRIERELSEKMAVACKAQFRFWTFAAADVRDLANQPPSPAAPALRVWLRRGVDWALCATLEGTPMLDPPEWLTVLYAPAELDLRGGLPPPGDFPVDILEKFKPSPADDRGLLKRHRADMRRVLQQHVPIALGKNYRYSGPVPLDAAARATALVPLDPAKEESRELARSKFRLEGVANGTHVTVYVHSLGRLSPASAAPAGRAPATAPTTAPATRPATAPTTPDTGGLEVVLREWHSIGQDPETIVVLQQNLARLQIVLEAFMNLQCKVIYLWEYVPDGSLPS